MAARGRRAGASAWSMSLIAASYLASRPCAVGQADEPVVLGQAAAHLRRRHGADRQPRPVAVEAVGRVERGHEGRVPRHDRLGHVRARPSGVPTYGHVGQVVAGCAAVRPMTSATSWSPSAMAASLVVGVGAVEGGQRTARLGPERLDLVGQTRQVGLGGVEQWVRPRRRPAAVTSGRPAEPGGWSSPVTSPAAPSAMTTMMASQTTRAEEPAEASLHARARRHARHAAPATWSRGFARR